MPNSNYGTLFLVSTPIGNLSEASPRVIETLRNAGVIACEDTRNTRKLLAHFDIHTKMVAYHNFNEEEESKKIVDILKNGEDVALVSDAGYPLISDPGYVLVNDVIDNDIKITVVSGPNAGLNALVASGLETAHYLFYGFLNAKPSTARKELEELKTFPYTMIFHEAPHRINKTLELMSEVLGNRKICIARELTKIHEEFIRGNINDLLSVDIKGEMVIVVEGNKEETEELKPEDLNTEVNELIEKGMKTKDACKFVADKYKVSKNDLYNNYLRNKN